MTKLSIAILGSGPSGAYAYRACKDYGCSSIDVYAKRPLFPTGAFWLYLLPKSISRRIAKGLEAHIDILGVGSPIVYAEKMWGEDVVTSYPPIARKSIGYHPRKGLMRLWGKKEKEFITDAGQFTDDDVALLAQTYDLVIQTFPTDQSKLIQPKPASFIIATRYFTGAPINHIICIYSGMRSHPWVRATVGFGQVSFEYPPNVPIGEIDLGADWFYDTAYDLLPETIQLDDVSSPNVILVGRFAQWKRKMLAHDAYEYVTSVLVEHFGESEKKRR